MRIAILGSTGSIGQITLQVARELKGEIEVVALAVKSDIDQLESQVREFAPKVVSIADTEKASEFARRQPGVEVVGGQEGLQALATSSDVDAVVVAIVGIEALSATVAAIGAKKRILLANKEILIAAGPLLMELAQQKGVEIIPLDSEHSALFQCLKGESAKEVRRLILTASGGPFLKASDTVLAQITPQQALAHPTWKMGKKITIDCSTLINKGFEMIEAAYLFGLGADKIDIVIHPQSLVHSFVEFIDGILIAQMHEPHMRFPIQYGLTYPRRLAAPVPPFDFTKHGHIDFYPPDLNRFRAVRLAYTALKEGMSLPCYLNGANEILVERFLKGQISWLQITEKLENLFQRHKKMACDSLQSVQEIDRLARLEAQTG